MIARFWHIYNVVIFSYNVDDTVFWINFGSIKSFRQVYDTYYENALFGFIPYRTIKKYYFNLKYSSFTLQNTFIL